MNTNIVIAGVIGIIIGSVVTYSLMPKQSAQQLMPRTAHVMPDGTLMGNDSMSMQGMVDALEGKSGDDFDKEFVTLMIEHHQGAIDMAKLAEENARHDEIKELSKNIIDAQAREIKDMKSWSQAWGYNN